MIVHIHKGLPIGEFKAPASKSYSHRYLIAAGLAKDSEVSNLIFSKDILASLSCLEALGCSYLKKESSVFFENKDKVIQNPVFDCKESGSTLRFFLPLALSKYSHCTFIGSERLMERGVSVYQDLFKEVTFTHQNGALILDGKIHSGRYEVVGNISSQYITGLLFTLPLLEGDSEIVLTTPLESKNYIDITLDVLSQFGIEIERRETGFYIRGNQTYQKKNVEVEGDCSNAAFLEAFSYLGAKTCVTGIVPTSLQGDKVYQDYFKQLAIGKAKLDISDCIDLGPVLFSFASLFHGGIFTGTRRLRIKESDRGEAMREELEKAGARVLIDENSIEVYPSHRNLSSLTFSSHNDHRIAMALSLYATVCDITIVQAEAVEKSFPDYFEQLSSHAMEVEYEDRL